jgi:hypothetical protein
MALLVWLMTPGSDGPRLILENVLKPLLKKKNQLAWLSSRVAFSRPSPPFLKTFDATATDLSIESDSDGGREDEAWTVQSAAFESTSTYHADDVVASAAHFDLLKTPTSRPKTPVRSQNTSPTRSLYLAASVLPNSPTKSSPDRLRFGLFSNAQASHLSNPTLTRPIVFADLSDVE